MTHYYLVASNRLQLDSTTFRKCSFIFLSSQLKSTVSANSFKAWV